MGHKSTPLDYWGNAAQVCWMMAEAQAVIAMRLMGIGGIWSVAPSENTVMVNEKYTAFNKGINNAMFAALSGKNSGDIFAAALKPIRQKTKSNYKRLSKRGPSNL